GLQPLLQLFARQALVEAGDRGAEDVHAAAAVEKGGAAVVPCTGPAFRRGIRIVQGSAVVAFRLVEVPPREGQGAALEGNEPGIIGPLCRGGEVLGGDVQVAAFEGRVPRTHLVLCRRRTRRCAGGQAGDEGDCEDRERGVSHGVLRCLLYFPRSQCREK